MSTINKTQTIRTHEGAKAKHITPEQQLRRSVLSCMLWEKEFYEDGVSIAERIQFLVPTVDPVTVERLAMEARTAMKLRHVPLLLCRELARRGNLDAVALARVIQRPDELTEFMAIYWKDGKCPVSKQVKLGLAEAFGRFNEYSLAKYNRDGKVSLRDVLFICHAKPKDAEQEGLFKRLIDGELATPDTWEVGISKGGDKKAEWTRLLSENKLGGMALIRNLRNMEQEGIDRTLIRRALKDMDATRILPYRFIAAARHAQEYEPELEQALFKALAEKTKLQGRTVLLVDVSGSMGDAMSGKSEMTRMDAACGLAMCCRELCEDIEILTFSEHVVKVPARRGFALRDGIINSQRHWSTYLGKAVKQVAGTYDRLIVITDEQSHDTVPDPGNTAYMINVASAQNGVGYGPWTHLDGFSEALLDYIVQSEAL